MKKKKNHSKKRGIIIGVLLSFLFVAGSAASAETSTSTTQSQSGGSVGSATSLSGVGGGQSGATTGNTNTTMQPDSKNSTSTTSTGADNKNSTNSTTGSTTESGEKSSINTGATVSDSKNNTSTETTQSDNKSNTSTETTVSDSKSNTSTETTVSDSKNNTSTTTQSDSKSNISTETTKSDNKNSTNTTTELEQKSDTNATTTKSNSKNNTSTTNQSDSKNNTSTTTQSDSKNDVSSSLSQKKTETGSNSKSASSASEDEEDDEDIEEDVEYWDGTKDTQIEDTGTILYDGEADGNSGSGSSDSSGDSGSGSSDSSGNSGSGSSDSSGSSESGNSGSDSTTEEDTKHSVELILQNVETETYVPTSVEDKSAMIIRLVPNTDYLMSSVKVTMGGVDQSSAVSKDMKTITFFEVTGDIKLMAIAEARISLADANITLKSNEFTYDGTAKTSNIDSVKVNGTTLVADTDYTASYKNNTNAGTATITIKGIGNYKGQATATFAITKASQTITATVDSTSIKQGGKTRVQVSGAQGSVSYKSGNTSVLSVAKDGTVTGKGAGSTIVTVTAAETANYKAQTLATDAIDVTGSISGAKISLSKSSYTYDGEAKTPTISVTLNKTTLTAGTDYSASYADNINAGTATVTVTGKGGYFGTAKKTFTISKASAGLSATIDESLISVGKTTKIAATGAQGKVSYTSGDKSVVTVSGNGTILGIGPGSTTITVTSAETANYKKTSVKETIQVQSSISGVTISLNPSTFEYDGMEKKPAVTVAYNGVELEQGTDYTVEYLNNVSAGTATARITAISGRYFTGQTSKDFTITKGIQSFTAYAEKDKIRVGKTSQITVSGAEGALSYQSSKSSVATVSSSGKIKGKKKGEATITITAAETDQKLAAEAQLTIKVKKKKTTDSDDSSSSSSSSSSKSSSSSSKNNSSKSTDTTNTSGKTSYAKGKVSAFLYGGKYVVKSGKKTATYSKKDSTTETVDIPNEVTIGKHIYRVTEIGKNAFLNNSAARSVSAGQNVKKIGKSAFSGASHLNSIALTDKIKKVGKNAFKGIGSNATISIKTLSYGEYERVRSLIRKAGAPSGALIVQEWD